MIPAKGTIELVEGDGYLEEKPSVIITRYPDGSLTITEYNSEGDVISDADYFPAEVA